MTRYFIVATIRDGWLTKVDMRASKDEALALARELSVQSIWMTESGYILSPSEVERFKAGTYTPERRPAEYRRTVIVAEDDGSEPIAAVHTIGDVKPPAFNWLAGMSARWDRLTENRERANTTLALSDLDPS